MKEDELTYGEVVKAKLNITEKEKYDLSSVINSLGKIAFFDELSEETKQQILNNVAILEKIVEG